MNRPVGVQQKSHQNSVAAEESPEFCCSSRVTEILLQQKSHQNSVAAEESLQERPLQESHSRKDFFETTFTFRNRHSHTQNDTHIAASLKTALPAVRKRQRHQTHAHVVRANAFRLPSTGDSPGTDERPAGVVTDWPEVPLKRQNSVKRICEGLLRRSH